MTPHYTDDWLTIYGGDCRDVLASLPSDSVDCVVTSPPYWGLRDYGSDGQLGLERTPEEYVANMVAVFREVRRVLKPSGTCWLNLGDSYAGGGTMAGFNDRYFGRETDGGKQAVMDNGKPARDAVAGLKPKDLVGIPWRVAFALQADSWYLRSDIIWSKPNPMPESVTDRPTKSHEYLFLLTKSARYYFDADAVREALVAPNATRSNPIHAELTGVNARDRGRSPRTIVNDPAGRNIRSVWNIATRPYPGAHFAVFPPELPERCIKAGSSERGVCPECGAPWERVLSVVGYDRQRWAPGEDQDHTQSKGKHGSTSSFTTGDVAMKQTTGWATTCQHTTTVPAVVLDPFAGSGTVGMVANRLSRRAILIDLNPEYLRQQMTRNAQAPLGLGA